MKSKMPHKIVNAHNPIVQNKLWDPCSSVVVFFRNITRIKSFGLRFFSGKEQHYYELS